jgi:thiol-disulfide isomerase/thioredoxin
VVAEEDVTFPPERLTDGVGRYELPVPLGNVRLTPPLLPAGYWPVTEKSRGLNQLQQFVVTRQQPVAEKQFTAQVANVWPMRVMTADGKPLADLEILAYRSADNSKSALVTDATGAGQLTLPKDGGKLSVGFFHRRLTETPRSHAIAEIDAGFDPRAVESQDSIAEGRKVVLTDKQGRKAVWEGCQVAIANGVAELNFLANDPANSIGNGEVIGQVVDHLGQPLTDAYVRCYASGLDLLQSLVKTDERGGFRFRGLAMTRALGEPNGIYLKITKAGFPGVESRHIFTPNAEGLHQLEKPIVLLPACSFRVQVLDEQDRPVEGAWVETSEPYHIAKSDEHGRCLLQDLAAGPLHFRVNYGDKRADADVTVASPSASEAPRVVRLAPISSQQDTRPPVPPFPRLGEAAPEWTIREWTDGKERTLASLRGRVVVLDFWSLGCTPCLQVTMPVENELQHIFAQDVTFIYIHPADTEIHLLRELLQAKQWNLLVGLDQGASHADSQTLKRYGVSGYPTEVIIDRDGCIAYHSNEGRDDKEQRTAKMKATAEEIGLPWPIEKDADQQEIARRLRRYHTHWLTKEIEKVLGK